MNFEPRQFVANTSGGTSTISLVTSGRDASHYEDSGNAVLSGVVTLLTGAKYNVNGTWKASSIPGVYRAVFLCRGANMQEVNNLAETLYDLAGRSGTLYGVEYTAGGVSTHSVACAVDAARPLSMLDKVGANVGRSHAIQVEMIFTRTDDWS